VDLREPEAAIDRMMTAVRFGAGSFWLGVDRRKSSWSRLNASMLAEVLEATGGAPVYLDARAVTPALAAVVIAAARKRGGHDGDIRGGIDFDPLASLASNGNLPWNLDACFSIMAEVLRWCSSHAPRLRSVAISTMPYAKAGAHAVQELALALATGAEYLRRFERHEILPDLACSQVRLLMPVGRDLAIEACKLRAMRLLWTRMTAACGVELESGRAPLHAVTSPVCMTTRDPWVNLLRTTTQAYAAVIGSADLLTILPFDSPLGTSDALANRLALNTHNILREESHLDRVQDPTRGSYVMERLTHDLAAAAWERFQRIEEAGGMAMQLQSGAIARELADTLSRRRRAVATRDDLITGVSSYPDIEELPVSRPQRARGRRPLPDEESTAVRRALGSACSTFAEVIDSAGEGIAVNDLLELFPGHDEPAQMAALPTHRDAMPFEQLRDAADRHRERAGTRPHVFLAVLGRPDEQRTAIADAASVLASGGITPVQGEGLESPADAAMAFEASGSRSAVICAPPDLVPDLARQLKARGAVRVLVSARPGELEKPWRAAGVDGFIHDSVDALEVLGDLFEVEGVVRG
jgi:methylmalonyl-CoA mutase